MGNGNHGLDPVGYRSHIEICHAVLGDDHVAQVARDRDVAVVPDDAALQPVLVLVRGAQHHDEPRIGQRVRHGDEVVHMIDVVSTNKTDFFREPAHFSFITQYILPEFVKQSPANRFFRAWSAGCSSGEEPYTLAMVLSEFILQYPAFDFSIYATDISSRILQKAVTAIYADERVDVVPMNMKKKYLLKSKDATKKTVRIVPTLRNKVTFNRLNFMDTSYDSPNNFDLVMCRNVLIYFDRETQEKVINRLCVKLKKGGYFMLGHSESIMNLDVPLEQIKPTVFRRL